jgi:rare lipoprotein A
MVDGSTKTMILRTFTAAMGLLALGGSINAVNAAEVAPVPVRAASHFGEAFQDLGATTAIAAQPDAVDVAALDTDDYTDVLGEAMPGGVASWYGAELAGHRTASGERFDPGELTAAHRTLPLGARVRVTYHGKSVIVRINDRGPYARGRVIDLSRAAAEQIGLRRAGSGHVELALLAS